MEMMGQLNYADKTLGSLNPVSQQIQVAEAEMVDATTPTAEAAPSSPRSLFFRSPSPPYSDFQILEVIKNDGDSPWHADGSFRSSQERRSPSIPDCFQHDYIIWRMTKSEYSLPAHQSISGEDDDKNITAILKQGNGISDEDDELVCALQAFYTNSYSCGGVFSEIVEEPGIHSLHEGNSLQWFELSYSEDVFYFPSPHHEGNISLQSSQAPQSPCFEVDGACNSTIDTDMFLNLQEWESSELRDDQTSSAKQIEVISSREAGGRAKQSLTDWSRRSGGEIHTASGKTRQPCSATCQQRRSTAEILSLTEFSSSKASASKDQLTYLLDKRLTVSDLRYSDNKIHLPKIFAETYLPPVGKDEESIVLEMEDFTGPYKWNFRLRCCQKGKCLKYQLEKTREYIDQYNLEAGDTIVIYKAQASEQFVIRSVKIEVAGSFQDNVSDFRKGQTPQKEESKKPTHVCRNDSEVAASDEIEKGEIAAADHEMNMAPQKCEEDSCIYEVLEDITRLRPLSPF